MKEGDRTFSAKETQNVFELSVNILKNALHKHLKLSQNRDRTFTSFLIK